MNELPMNETKCETVTSKSSTSSKRSKQSNKSNRSKQSNKSNKSKGSRQSKQSSRSSRSSKSNRTKNDVESITTTEEKRDLLDKTFTSAATGLFGTQVNNIIPLDPVFIHKMEEICNAGPFPSELILQLKNSGINTPHILVNTFGGGIATLAKK